MLKQFDLPFSASNEIDYTSLYKTLVFIGVDIATDRFDVVKVSQPFRFSVKPHSPQRQTNLANLCRENLIKLLQNLERYRFSSI